MKKQKFHSYKIHLVQELNEDYFDRRVELTEIIRNTIQQDRNAYVGNEFASIRPEILINSLQNFIQDLFTAEK